MNRENLQKLATYLMNLPADYKHFNMTEFCSRDVDISPDNMTEGSSVLNPNEHRCGTVACALGHGPNAGVKPNKKDYSWWHYSDNHFVDSQYEHPIWSWCFSQEWYYVDNTPQGAGKRIQWLLDNGLPGDYYYQMTGSAKLCYK